MSTRWTKSIKLRVLDTAIEGKKWHIHQFEGKHGGKYRYPKIYAEYKDELDWLKSLRNELKTSTK